LLLAFLWLALDLALQIPQTFLQRVMWHMLLINERSLIATNVHLQELFVVEVATRTQIVNQVDTLQSLTTIRAAVFHLVNAQQLKPASDASHLVRLIVSDQ
jgi:hypothetical protein